VQENKIPHFHINACLKFDPARIADWVDAGSVEPYTKKMLAKPKKAKRPSAA
jgi:hypothetical protein